MKKRSPSRSSTRKRNADLRRKQKRSAGWKKRKQPLLLQPHLRAKPLPPRKVNQRLKWSTPTYPTLMTLTHRSSYPI